MWNAGGAEHDGKWTELLVLAAVSLTILPIEKETEEWQFVGVARQLPWNGMAKIGEDCTGVNNSAANGTEEIAAAEAMFRG
jgi:hypothetical protein